MAGFYEAMTMSIIVSVSILVGVMLCMFIKEDDFDDFAH